MFQGNKESFGTFLILRTRFKDTKNSKILEKRREDWIKDLNMNLVTGKVVRTTHFFEDLPDFRKLDLLKALDSEPGLRDDAECKQIERYIRSMTFFKPYSEFESKDI